MESKDHYLTYAVIFVTDRNYGEVPYCSIDYGEVEGNGIIRKLCFCGSSISYDQDNSSWVCTTSQTTISKQSVLAGNCHSEPLVPLEMPTCQEQGLEDLSHPENDSQIVLAGTQLNVFIKIPSKRLWLISDPLPVGNHFATNSIASDLFVEWRLEIGFDLPGSIDITIPLNVFNAAHRDYLWVLASGAEVYLYFLEKDSLKVIGRKPIRPNEFYRFTIEGAFRLAERLPDNSAEREEALKDFRESQEWSTVAMCSKFGLPQCTEFLTFFLGKRSFENFPAHVATCHQCQKFFPPSD